MDICNKCCQLDYPMYQYIIRNVIVSEYQFSGHGMNFNFSKLLNIVLPDKEILKQPAIQNFKQEHQKVLNKIHNKFVNQ